MFLNKYFNANKIFTYKERKFSILSDRISEQIWVNHQRLDQKGLNLLSELGGYDLYGSPSWKIMKQIALSIDFFILAHSLWLATVTRHINSSSDLRISSCIMTFNFWYSTSNLSFDTLSSSDPGPIFLSQLFILDTLSSTYRTDRNFIVLLFDSH